MDNQRLILIIALSMVLFLIWQAWIEEQMAKNPPPSPPATSETPAAAPGQPGDAPAPAPPDDVPIAAATPPLPSDSESTSAAEVSASAGAERIRIITDQYTAEIDPVGGSLVSVGLRQYPVTLNRPDQPFPLLSANPADFFVAQSGLVASSGSAPNHYDVYRSEQQEYRLADGQDVLEVPLTWRDPDGVTVTKTYRFRRGDFAIDLEHKVDNGSGQVWVGQQYQQLQRTRPAGDGPSLMGGVYTYTGGVVSTPEEPYEKIDFDTIAERQRLKDELDDEIQRLRQTGADPARLSQLQAELRGLRSNIENGWIAMIQHYFLAAWVPPANTSNTFYTVHRVVDGYNRYTLQMRSEPLQSVAPGASTTFGSTLFVGPKIQDRLEELAPNLSRTVDYGWLWFIAEPLFKLLKWIYGWVGNWGWAIVIITILIKLVFYKLSETSYRSMANMRKLAPQMQKLKDRYGDDRQKLNQAMMEMYKKEKINPLGGCLPILVQIPVFIALYWMLLESVELRHAPWIGWIDDLSAQDPYYILPLIMGASMFIQQKLNPTPPDPIQAKIMMALPIVFTFFFLWFPAGLVLYWVVNNILSILQQYVITKRVEAGTDKPDNKAKAKA